MDRSLDEIIAEDPRKQNRPSASGGRRNQGRRRDRSDGIRKVLSAGKPIIGDLNSQFWPNLSSFLATQQPQTQERFDLNLDWVHDKYEDGRDARPARNSRRSRRSTSPDRGGSMLTKVRVENLHYDINEQDLQDLFGRIGPVNDLSLLYDRAGRSEGVAFVTYKYLKDAHESVKEYDGANAKGHPIRLSLVSGRREQNKSLFDRVERPNGRDARSLSPGGDDAEGRRRRGGGGRGRRSDVSKPAPDNIDRYIPGERGERGGDRSPARRGGGRRGGRDNRDNRDNRGRNENGGGRRPRKTQEELDQEMEDYWGGNAGTENADQQPAQEAQQTAAPAEPAPVQAAAPAAAAHNDDDIDMIE
ncbi:uncharacterized protein N7483_000783 [Penicillium malachiteum]|uniref:uncharacterized protein n=1 Tax=Penicillium malachiteum TaxID=1324776 RepID=UPI00254731D8|nr:uncharacterized protein N7483_000783 [Penicillium malachiteum]KAJ5735658.1 hypothetical protein N7483_000783 [Penicillium malachiteum]